MIPRSADVFQHCRKAYTNVEPMGALTPWGRCDRSHVQKVVGAMPPSHPTGFCYVIQIGVGTRERGREKRKEGQGRPGRGTMKGGVKMVRRKGREVRKGREGEEREGEEKSIARAVISKSLCLERGLMEKHKTIRTGGQHEEEDRKGFAFRRKLTYRWD